MVGSVNVSPVAPVTPTTPVMTEANNFSAQVNQSAAASFAENVALQDTSALLGLSSSSGSGSSSQTDIGVLQDSLTNLSPQALVVLNETDNITAGTAANTNLTSVQLQEMQILQNDIAQITAAEDTTPSISLTENGTPVNISVAALNALNDVAAVNNLSSANELTTAQIQQAATAIAPFLNQPLTPQVITQIQSALVTAGFNPEQLSLQNLFISINYAAAEATEAHSPDTIAMNEMVTEMETMEP
jgi:hypothetical protein